MESERTRDFATGLFVLLGLGSLAYLSLSIGGYSYSGQPTIPIYAKFDQIAGLKARAPVEISGVRVGHVTSIVLDDDYRARVNLEVNASLELPVDSSASIVTSGLLGDRYIALEPGAEEVFLTAGEAIPYTESALVLERLVGKFLYNVDSDSE